MVNTEIRLLIFFADKDGEARYSQQKQDWELTVAHIMNSLLPNSDLNWKKVGKTTRPFSYGLNQIPHDYFPGGSDGKVSACNAGDPGLIPGLGRSLGEGNGCYPLFLHLSWSYNPLPHWAPTDMHLYFYDFQVVQFFSIGRTSILYSSMETKKSMNRIYTVLTFYIFIYA